MNQPISPGFAPSTQLVRGVVQERSPLTVILLSLFTCGIYALYWLFKTTDELKVALQDNTINPVVDLLLALFTAGIWGIYVNYRNAQKIHQALAAREPSRTDQSQPILLLSIGAYFVGFTHLIAQYILQEELNRLAQATR